MNDLSAALANNESAESHRNSIRNVTKETIALSRRAAQCGSGIPATRGRSHKAPRDNSYCEAHYAQQQVLFRRSFGYRHRLGTDCKSRSCDYWRCRLTMLLALGGVHRRRLQIPLAI